MLAGRNIGLFVGIFTMTGAQWSVPNNRPFNSKHVEVVDWINIYNSTNIWK